MSLETALAQFSTQPLLKASRALFKDTLHIPLGPLADTAITPQRFFRDAYRADRHDGIDNLFLVGRMTDDSFHAAKEADGNNNSDLDANLAAASANDYQGMFLIAADLGDRELTRSDLAARTRDINRTFSAPVIVVFKHTTAKQPVLSIGVASRRPHKRDKGKNVLGKVSMIREINLETPHRGHLDILRDFSFAELEKNGGKGKRGHKIDGYKSFHAALEQIFNTDLLNKNFYDELSNWFFWAKSHCHFPLYDPKADKYDLFHDSDKAKEHEAKNLIRLLTRTLFVWFIKERGLVPASLFSPADLKKVILKSFDSESTDTHYYKAVLQNLFFATLNQTHGEREFRKEGRHQNTTTLLRYKDSLTSPADFIQTVEDSTPFLNGGLFECLDRPHPTKTGSQGGKVIIYEDGFSDRKDNPLRLPDFLFFGAERRVNLSGEDVFGIASKSNVEVRGLIHILDSYKFTIVENTPIDQEIALDPELLGQVFENLLASYNPETKTTARKQTGSFYTPRPIVDYMVDESLKAHLKRALVEEASMKADDADAGLELLFAYNDRDNPFEKPQTDILIRAIDNCKILDPACGSGAFPMGALQKLVYVLGKLDPGDELWEQRQLAKVDKMIEAAQDIDDTTFRERAIADAQAQKKDIEEAFAKNELGYGRKLYLIENCLYGVDIQSIATQVTKLRFFISLIVDQTVDRQRQNFGVRPLPNLETKFVTADTLIQIEKPSAQGELFELAEVSKLQRELKQVRHELFAAKTPRTKNAKRQRDKELREAIAAELRQNGWDSAAAAKLAAWDPYDQNASAPYFDPEWMFGLKAFDIVIGNPPYVQIQKYPKQQKDQWVAQNYQTYAATADIYCLFYERGAQLLKDGGSLLYITSNKWMRAGYGEKLRKFLSSKVTVNELLDFWGILVFQAATVDTNVLRFTKEASKTEVFSSTMLPKEFNFEVTLDEYVNEHSAQFTIPANSAENWAVLSADRQKIRKLVEAQGIPIKSWDIQINRGALTGLNDAFYITSGQRDAFVSEDPKCDKLIVPLLRGRYLERYGTSWDETWMIAAFPALKLAEADIPKPILKHLRGFLPQLNQTGESFRNKEGKPAKTRKKTEHKWFETQDSIAYHEEFLKPKIIYPEITKRLGFYYDSHTGFVPNNKAYIITSPSNVLPHLTAFLNSSLFKCCYKDNFPTQGEDRRELRTIFFELLRVKKPNTTETEVFEKLVPLVQFAKKTEESAPTAFLEDLIDACVMECYFREHMAERDLLFHDTVAPHLAAYDPEASEAQQRDFLTHLHQTLNAPSHPIRQRLDRISTASPDLLAVIKKEGKV